MSSLFGILCLLSAPAATSYSYSCSQCSFMNWKCSGNNNTCPSGERCGFSYTKGVTGSRNAVFLGKPRVWSSGCSPFESTSAQGKIRKIKSCCNTDDCNLYSPACDKMADILARTYKCASECNFLGSIRLQQLQISMGTICYSDPECTMIGNLPTENSPLNGLGCPSCLSVNSTWCHTDETLQCRGDETMCLLLQTTQESGSMSTSTAFRGCATMSMCDLGSQSQNKTGSFTEVKINCTRASTSGSNRGSMSVHKVVLTSAIVCLLLKLLF
ncbi:phospholipase A2 inhibitor NAI-like [Bufo gargarizans]|uniref:phospholipase A2 inhibitor NAI-like n=1 Tax=Bufo gargarizans TaxID=30331 RepID=UPI001CF440F4|nr:phospholipase A2 inhibitor NAI-like [Bufo gargarizans]